MRIAASVLRLFGRIVSLSEDPHRGGRVPRARLVARNYPDSVWRRPGPEPPGSPAFGSDAPDLQRLAFQATREVRHTVISVIAAHLKKDAAVSWQGLDLDFTCVVFDSGIDFGRAEFSGGTVNFRGARFSGDVDFGTVFSGGAVFFHGAEFTGCMVDFRQAWFSSGRSSSVAPSSLAARLPAARLAHWVRVW